MRDDNVPDGYLPDEMSVFREYLHSGGGNISHGIGTSFETRGSSSSVSLWSLPASLIPSVTNNELPRALHDSHLGGELDLSRW